MALTMTNLDKLEILITSGPIAVGKSSIVNALISNFGYKKISSGEYLSQLATKTNLEPVRDNLIKLGDELDKTTDYSWVVDQVSNLALTKEPQHRRWVFDSVRKHKQVDHFRKRYSTFLTHVHFTARETILEQRYNSRLNSGSTKDVSTYHHYIEHPNEKEARSLSTIADVIIDTSDTPATDLAYDLYRSLL